jgi:uncharacterized membrane protein YvlD (DUF360 family)
VKGFIIGTLATALTFAIVSFVLPAIDYGGDPVGLLVVSLIAGVVNGLLKRWINNHIRTAVADNGL